jgi:hypothetical protein
MHQFENIPDALKKRKQWLLWKLQKVKDRPKPTKIPYSAHSGMGKSNDSSTWASFEECSNLIDDGFDGIGFAFSPEDGLVGIDLDGCIDSFGVVSDEAKEILSHFRDKSFIELSPSGKGFHLYCLGVALHCGKGQGKKSWVEVYDSRSSRYFTVTGNAYFGQCEPQDCQSELQWLHEKYTKREAQKIYPQRRAQPVPLDDYAILEKARGGKNGADFSRLYDRGAAESDNPSALDLALCNALAFWFGCDLGRMDRAFRSSALMRDKWDRSVGKGENYGERTMQKAISGCTETYSPKAQNETSSPVENGNELDKLPLIPEKPKAHQFPNTPLDKYIQAVQDRTQAPYILCAQSVLSAATFSVQHLADIEMPGIGGYSARRPISNFFLTIARSGERKSSADRIVLEGIEARRRALDQEYSEGVRRYERDLLEYKKELAEALARGEKEDTGEPPILPRKPILRVKEPTQEGLFRSLAEGELSQGLFNDEGGVFVGGHGMSKDNRMRMASTLNSLWDGSRLDRIRAQGHEAIEGRRFCLHLMIQPRASDALTNDPMLRDLGFTARCLAAEPESTIGKRPYKRASQEAIYQSSIFKDKILANLELKAIEDERGLHPRTIGMSDSAMDAWINFHDQMEERLLGAYSSIQSFAGKTPEHAIRLAAVLTLFENSNAEKIEFEAMAMGIELAHFYIQEKLRLEVGRASEEDEAAELLINWMKTRNEPITSISDICQWGPVSLRTRKKAQEAIKTSVEAGHLKESGKGIVNGKNRRVTFSL